MTKAGKALILYAMFVFALSVLTIVLIFNAQKADSAEAAAPSPVKAFQNLPDNYQDIIAGCIGVNGWYTNQNNTGGGHASLVIIASDPNCLKGRVLNP